MHVPDLGYSCGNREPFVVQKNLWNQPTAQLVYSWFQVLYGSCRSTHHPQLVKMCTTYGAFRVIAYSCWRREFMFAPYSTSLPAPRTQPSLLHNIFSCISCTIPYVLSIQPRAQKMRGFSNTPQLLHIRTELGQENGVHTSAEQIHQWYKYLPM
jgi:hypothetical protein